LTGWARTGWDHRLRGQAYVECPLTVDSKRRQTGMESIDVNSVPIPGTVGSATPSGGAQKGLQAGEGVLAS